MTLNGKVVAAAVALMVVAALGTASPRLVMVTRRVHRRATRVVQVPVSKVQVSVETTSYCDRGTTFSGAPAGPGSVAVDPRYIPLGTVLNIPGYGMGIAQDTGSLVKGWHIDLWLSSCAASVKWGVRTKTVTVWLKDRAALSAVLNALPRVVQPMPPQRPPSLTARARSAGL